MSLATTSAHPATKLLVPPLQDFSKIWRQLEPIEQRGLLTAMFAGVFFDTQGRIQLVLAKSPFETLLGMSDEEPSAL